MEDDRAAHAAATWYARRGPAAVEDAGFRRWHAAHPTHEPAWRRVQNAGMTLDGIAGEPEIAALIEQARRSPYRPARWTHRLALAATLLSVGGALLIHYGATHLAAPCTAPTFSRHA